MTIAEFKKLMTDYYTGNGTVIATYGLSSDLTFGDVNKIDSQFGRII
jgi:hypothetical protein